MIKANHTFSKSVAVAVKFSKGAMFKLKCLDFIVNHLFFIHSKHYPYVALLGADENGVIRGIAPLVKGIIYLTPREDFNGK